MLKAGAKCPFPVVLTCLIFTSCTSFNTYNSVTFTWKITLFVVIQIYVETFSSNIYKSTEVEPPLGMKQESNGEEVLENTL